MTDKEALVKEVSENKTACLQGDSFCYAKCPYLERCWKIDDNKEEE